MIKRLFKFCLTPNRFFQPIRQSRVRSLRRANRQGFSLVEILTVIVIFSILTIAAGPAIQGLQKSGNFTKEVYNMSDALNMARTYAVANNSYVYVGLAEVDRTQSTSAAPQVYTSGQGGRLALSIVATKDGTSTMSSGTLTTGNLSQVRPTQLFDFLHVPAASPTITGMPTANVTKLNPAATVPTTPFSMPLAASTAQYNYNLAGSSWVICFNPQGGMLVNGIPAQWVELDLEPVSGNNIVTGNNLKNEAALIIDGATGDATVYRL